MVYCGKPSAGCENCRKARKRCGLERPTCERCLRLRKACGGYPDRSQIRIRDQSEAVMLKATKRKTAPSSELPIATGSVIPEPFDSSRAPAPDTSSSSSKPTLQPPEYDHDAEFELSLTGSENDLDSSLSRLRLNNDLHPSIKPSPEDVAMNYFLHQFTSTESSNWNVLRYYAMQSNLYPCLDLAMRACGMAALVNVENVAMGKTYAQTTYMKALGLLNEALRDPNKSRADDCLTGVAVLGYYETITCDNFDSMQSWKAHINGGAQLLKLRGRAQLQSPVGRHLFREMLPQILITCIWDSEEPPAFLWDLESQLEAMSADQEFAAPTENLTKIAFSFATLRARMRLQTITDVAAAEEASHIKSRLNRWSAEAIASDVGWHYSEVIVPDSSHVWNGMMHRYNSASTFGAWMAFRSISIILTRTQQELLDRSMPVSTAEGESQRNSFEAVRRQMVDEICAAVPCVLFHPYSSGNPSCALIRAYSAIWPLYMAGTCALEREGSQALGDTQGDLSGMHRTSAASAQAAWILGRLQYIATHVGLKWAGVIATFLEDNLRSSVDQTRD